MANILKYILSFFFHETKTNGREVISSHLIMKLHGILQHRCLGPASWRGCRMTAGIIVIVVIIIVTRLAGMTRAVKSLMSEKGVIKVEADVAGVTVARTAFAGIQTFFRRWRVLAFLLHLISDCRYQWRLWRRWRRWLRALLYLRLAIHLNLCGDLLRRRSRRRFRCRKRRLIIQYARYVIFLLK